MYDAGMSFGLGEDIEALRESVRRFAAERIAPQAAEKVIDWAVQAHGAAGVSQDTFLAKAWAHNRTLRLADGPDEVHRETIARVELRKYAAPRDSH